MNTDRSAPTVCTREGACTSSVTASTGLTCSENCSSSSRVRRDHRHKRPSSPPVATNACKERCCGLGKQDAWVRICAHAGVCGGGDKQGARLREDTAAARVGEGHFRTCTTWQAGRTTAQTALLTLPRCAITFHASLCTTPQGIATRDDALGIRPEQRDSLRGGGGAALAGKQLRRTPHGI